MNKNVVVLASDHSGLELKKSLIKYLKSFDFEICDVGPYEYKQDDDYPDFVAMGNKEVLNKNCIGVYICASGIGVSMAANRAKGIRAVNASIEEHAYLARLHEDANVICFGQKFIAEEDAIKIFNAFINTDFEGGRHLRRISKY